MNFIYHQQELADKLRLSFNAAKSNLNWEVCTFKQRETTCCESQIVKKFWAKKQFVKLQPTYSIKLVFSYVVKGMKIQLAAKFHAFVLKI